nr:MAG: RNA-dependent RNA polymerase [Hangzhou steitz-like virus 5]
MSWQYSYFPTFPEVFVMRDLKSLENLPFLLDLFQKVGQDLGLHWRDLKTLALRGRKEGLSFFTKTLPSLGKALDQAFNTKRFLSPSNFKTARNSTLPVFLGSYFSKVFHDSGEVRKDACVYSVYILRQLLFFAYKVKLPYSEVQKTQVIERFVQVESELAAMDIADDPILETASIICNQVFAGYKQSDLEFRHGPGVTANVSQLDKFEHRIHHGTAASRFDGSFFFFNENDAFDASRLYRYPVHNHHELFWNCNNVAKVLLVPKDSRGPRLISAEPSENMWIQQGIKDWVTRRLESHHLTKGQVNFADQTVNQALAIKASLNQEFATLDLKDASDRVSLQLVELLFRGSDLLTDLVAARSTGTRLPSGDIIPLHKYAPMGSALCFPVLASSIYFILVAGLVGLGSSLRDACSSVYVYGDDIIVPTRFAEFCIALLERYGLRVNRDKSFVNSRFAESCGTDSFDGNVVTPVRLRNLWEKTLIDQRSQRPGNLAELCASLTETANLLAKSGLRKSAELIYSVTEFFCGPLPYGLDHSPYLNRRINPIHSSSIAEFNYLTLPQLWRKVIEPSTGKLVLTSVMKCVRIVPLKTEADFVTVYGHMMRTFPMLGQGMQIPYLAEFVLPRDIKLSRSRASLSDQSGYPANKWLPQ